MSEKNYCTILDLLEKNGKSDLVNLIARLCLSSVFTRRSQTKSGKSVGKTFLLPPDSILKKIAKMSDEEAMTTLRRHVVYNIYTREFIKKLLDEGKEVRMHNLMGEDLEVSADGKSVGGAKIKDEIQGGSNGIILVVDDAVSSTNKSKSIKSTKSVKKTSAKKTQKGGGIFGMFQSYHTNPILNDSINFCEDLSDLSGMALRYNILEHYRRKWPLNLYPLNTEFNYYVWLYSSLINYLKNIMPNFGTLYEPINDPIIGVELLLQFRNTSPSTYFLSDDILRDWFRSSYWLSGNPQMIDEAIFYLSGGKKMQGGNNEMSGTMGKYIRGSPYETSYLKIYIDSVKKILRDRNIPEQKKRLYVIDVYKEIESDDNFRTPDNKKLYMKVGKDNYYLVSAAQQLQMYFTANYLFPLSGIPLSGGKINTDILYGGGNSEKQLLKKMLSNEYISKFDELMCGFFDSNPYNIVNSILQPQLTSGYRFDLNFIESFVNSPFFLPSTSFLKENMDKYYVLRSPYTKIQRTSNEKKISGGGCGLMNGGDDINGGGCGLMNGGEGININGGDEGLISPIPLNYDE